MNREIKSVEEELLYKIVEQWGNAMCPLSEKVKWLKEYAAQFTPAIVGARWVKASELKEINWPLCIRYDGGGAPYYTTVCSMKELHKHVSKQNPIDEIEYLHEQIIANSNVNAWVNGKYFKDDWDDFGMYHWRYADDHYKLDTDVFENRQPGFLHKIGGEGFVEYSQIEWLDESQEQPIKSAPDEWTNEDVECMADTLYLFSIGEKGFADDSKQNWTLDFVKKRASEILNKHYYKDDEIKNPVS